MEEKEIIITDKIMNIRNGIEKADIKNRKQLSEDLDYIEDMLSAMINFVYGISDCTMGLAEDMEDK